MIIWCIVGGLLSGVVAGMGMGGGSLLIPILTLLGGVGQHPAQGANMAAFLPSSVIAIIIHKKAGRINFKECLPIVLYGLLFSGLGAYIATMITGKLLRKMFALFLIGLCVAQIFIEIKQEKDKK